eukprot:15331927-Ditylum_brightwellii.AAC.2
MDFTISTYDGDTGDIILEPDYGVVDGDTIFSSCFESAVDKSASVNATLYEGCVTAWLYAYTLSKI